MLDVLLHGQLAGRLQRKPNGNLQFRYDETYIEAAGPALSLGMPVREGSYPHRACLAFFGNLLPEADVRLQMALAAGISAGSDYGLLERFGGDVAGAVTLIPREAQHERPASEAQLEVLSAERLDEILRRLPKRPLAADDRGEIRLSLAGAQSKLPVVDTGNGFALPHTSQLATTHILKPEPERFPGLVANEFFCMRLAAEAGIEAARVQHASTASGLPYLIVTRYDRDLTQDPIRRLHQEDLCQATGRLPSEKYQAEGGPSVREAVQLIDRHSAVPARDRGLLFSALVLNILIGNCDAHGKNFSLLYDSSAPGLAPLYDLVSTASYPELTTRLAMSIDGARRLEDISPSAWTRLAADTGFAPRFVERTLSELAPRIAAAAAQLTKLAEHDNPTAARIAEGVIARARMCT